MKYSTSFICQYHPIGSNIIMNIERTLIIREPWISLILSGEKIWEMRSGPTSVRGWIGLTPQGHNEVLGLARIVDSRLPLHARNYAEHMAEHAIPPEQIAWALENNWVFPWVLADVIRLPEPIRFSSRPGAVKFVNLDLNIGANVAALLGKAQPLSQTAPLEADRPPGRLPSLAPAGTPALGEAAIDGPIFIYAPQRAHARAVPTVQKQIKVLKGSTAMRSGSAKKKRDGDYRDAMIEDGVLVAAADPELLVFSRDYTFDSASRAAGVIKDGNASGPSQWVRPDTGETPKDFFEKGI